VIEAELARHAWASLRAAGPASDLPGALRALATADTAEAADAAYWRLDNHVLVQGALHQAAEATAAAAVIALSGATVAGRARLLELLGQIGAGQAAPEEVAAGNTGLADRCLGEIARGFPIYVAILGAARDPDEIASAVDLIGLAARADATLKERARHYLEQARQKTLPGGLHKLMESWIDEL
jgi:hypothetical protein